MSEQEEPAGGPDTPAADLPAVAIRPGAAWVMVPRYVDQGMPIWYASAEDARASLASVRSQTWYLCRLEAAAGPKADLLPIGSAGQL